MDRLYSRGFTLNYGPLKPDDEDFAYEYDPKDVDNSDEKFLLISC